MTREINFGQEIILIFDLVWYCVLFIILSVQFNEKGGVSIQQKQQLKNGIWEFHGT